MMIVTGFDFIVYLLLIAFVSVRLGLYLAGLERSPSPDLPKAKVMRRPVAIKGKLS